MVPVPASLMLPIAAKRPRAAQPSGSARPLSPARPRLSTLLDAISSPAQQLLLRHDSSGQANPFSREDKSAAPKKFLAKGPGRENEEQPRQREANANTR